jgi:hypothetical protein
VFRVAGNSNDFAQSRSEEHPMTTRKFLFAAAAILAALAMQSSAHALTITECSAKYKDAKAAGTLNGASWNDFRKSQCDLTPRKRSASAPGPDVAVVAANAVFPACDLAFTVKYDDSPRLISLVET